MPPVPYDIEALREAAVEAAQAAGEVALSGFKGDLQIRSKGHNDIVTQYDNAAEDVAIATLMRRFPQYGILAEESGESAHANGQQPDIVWAIDPIDGTHNYAMQLPFWCCSVAAMDRKRGKVVAGAVFDALHGELFSAGDGLGATLNGDAIHVAEVTKLADAALAYDIGYEAGISSRMMRLAAEIQPQVRRMRLLGSAVLAITYVAAGRIDGFYHLGLQTWDVAAASLLVKEAGGVITDWSGGPVGLVQGSAVAANPQIHAQLLALLRD